VLLLPNVYAIAIGLPKDIDSRLSTIKYNQEETYSFRVVNGGAATQVRFFATPELAGIVSVAGAAKYEETFNMGADQTKVVNVTFKGLKKGVTVVSVGVVQAGSAGELSFDQVLKRSFEVEVTCTSSQCGEAATPVATTTTTTTSSSLGGGGGGASAPSQGTPTTPPATQSSPSPPVVESTVPVANVRGITESQQPSQAQVPMPVAPTPLQNTVVKKALPVSGIVFLLSLIGLVGGLLYVKTLVGGMSDDVFA